MAKSKNGGSRAFIRGRLGSDVYSVGKNGKGERQQVVRSLAEQVSNPRTTAQMQGRMIMSTVMQGVSALAPIIDHSFDGIATGQPSISEFIRINYGLIKVDVAAHPSADNQFQLNEYQEKGVKTGAYQLSSGSVVRPTSVEAGVQGLVISLTNAGLTVGGLRNAIGVSADGYLTLISIQSDGQVAYVRVKVKESLEAATVISSANVGTLFDFEGNYAASASLEGNLITISFSAIASLDCYGVILSSHVDGVWKHSTCVLNNLSGEGDAADDVLPTYPVGTDMFLNGGDL